MPLVFSDTTSALLHSYNDLWLSAFFIVPLQHDLGFSIIFLLNAAENSVLFLLTNLPFGVPFGPAALIVLCDKTENFNQFLESLLRYLKLY